MTKREKYFLEQKLIGLGVLVLSILFIPVGIEFEALIGSVLLAPLGLWLMVTKQMLIVNDYYDEVQERRRHIRSH